MGVVRGNEVLQHSAGASGRHVAGAQHVFDGDRDASQPAQRLAPLPLRVHGLRLGQCGGLVDVEKRVDLRVAGADGGQEGGGDGLSRFALRLGGQEFGGGSFSAGHGRYP